ncbi:Spy/CpxP family protein refolding chaperone [Microvirga splendida]|uniref:Spy/CpxP family protein refolding chaperone n=1 Tax=Microvirga splendida TaxID=2795727 RepID=A0ABS0Y3I9_9HYPH|nr:Spy/CpxP family protein refolding chaperone [Microvirga splendida]MBJ6126829.1 Spy/CpxP family protein refolding chaperone [Microvirga splendida]
MRTSFALAAAVSVLALVTVPQVAHAAEQRDPSPARIVVAMDNMGNMQQSPAGGGTPAGQSSGGMSMCCGMGGMSASGQATMAPSGQAGSGAMPSGQAGQMGSGMMNDNMRSMPQGQMGGMPQGGSGQGGGTGMMDDNMMRMQQGQTGMAPMGQGGMMMDNMRRMQPNQQGGMGMMNNDPMRMPPAPMGGTMPGMTAGGADMTDRIEGRIAFLKAELKITDAQAPAWNQFAEALRSSRQHLIEARQLLAAPAADATAATRLEQYERHLGARLEALKAARSSFAQLHAGLDEHQKHVAEELVVPLLATF